MDTHFLTALDQLSTGYQTGLFGGERWGVTLRGGPGNPVRKLYGERLAGGDHVSFNLYTPTSGPILKPCEMPEEKVIDFVLEFEPDG